MNGIKRCVVLAGGTGGAKLAAGSALYSRDGDRQGFARQTWITPTAPGTPL